MPRSNTGHFLLYIHPFRLILHSQTMAAKPGPLYYATLGMSLLYFLAGLFFLVAPQAEQMFPGYRHYVIALALLCYGVFRMFRLRKIRRDTYGQE